MSLHSVRRRFLVAGLVIFGTASLLPYFSFGTRLLAQEEEKTNIVVILVDDMGFSDIGPYGSEIPTPHLDRLAKNGVRFSQFYNTGRCCPTRASLLTGLYSHQTGIGHMTADQGEPGYRGHLNKECVTIAEVLKEAGYFTAMTGKWHVGFNHGVTPWGRGFDRSLNLPAGGVYMASDSPKCKLHLNGEAIDNDDPRLPKDWYGTDLWTDFGIDFIDEAIENDQPFFLYLAHVAPHFPLQASAEDIDKFRGEYRIGWDKLAEARLERQRAIGLIPKEWQPETRPQQINAWEQLTASEQDRFDHLMAAYAAVVHRMDQSVGRLVQALEERDQLENTMILFMSDNGGNAEAGVNGRTKGDPTTAESSWFCGRSWAHLQNTPFRKYKHFNHEGGIATPLIVHWPRGITEARWVHEPSHVIDVMATCIDAGRATYPDTYQGNVIQPLQGTSLLPLVCDNESLPERTLFWEHEGNAAIRVGNLKLVREGSRGEWELFDMNLDRTEQNNLASQHQEQVVVLSGRWRKWAEEVNAIPKPKRNR